MAINNSKQSVLEKEGFEERHKEVIRSDYNKNDFYHESHIDALSDPSDESKYMGKGTNSGGHQHYVPDFSKPKTLINYSNLDTQNGGGSYDIHGKDGKSGRNRLLAINIYNKDNSYGLNSVDTSANIADGQYVFNN